MKKRIFTLILTAICLVSAVFAPNVLGENDRSIIIERHVYFTPELSGYGKDLSGYFAENFPEVTFFAVKENTYYYDMWNPTEQEKYIYANWADTTNYMGKGFRQVYYVLMDYSTFTFEQQNRWNNNKDFVSTLSNLLQENQMPHTELVTFTCGDLDDDGQTTSQDALIILRSIVGLEQLNQYEYALADADFNFTVDSLDALEVLKISVGETAQPF